MSREVVFICPNESRITLQLEPDMTISAVRALVAERIPHLVEGKVMRLVFVGRVLSDNMTCRSAGLFALNPDDVVSIHVVLTDAPSLSSDGSPSSSLTSHRGFNKLRLLGLSVEQVEEVRNRFASDIITTMSDIPERPDESPAMRILRAEELWMSRQDDDSEFFRVIRPILSRSIFNQPRFAYIIATARAQANNYDDITEAPTSRVFSVAQILLGVLAAWLFGPMLVLFCWLCCSQNKNIFIGLFIGLILHIITTGIYRTAEENGGSSRHEELRLSIVDLNSLT